MLTQQTIAQLHALKLQGMVAALQRQIEQPAAGEMTFEERLALLVQHECDSRYARRCARLLTQPRRPGCDTRRLPSKTSTPALAVASSAPAS